MITCRFAVKKVSIDPSLLGEDKDMLEDLVMAAMNDAVAKAEAATQAKMAGFTAGLNLPPLSDRTPSDVIATKKQLFVTQA